MSTLPVIRAGRAISLAGLAGAAALGALLGLVLASHPPTGAMAAAGVLGVAAVLALAVASYETAIALGFLLLGVVRVEPAPSDVLLATVAAVAIATGRLDLRRVPGPMSGGARRPCSR